MVADRHNTIAVITLSPTHAADTGLTARRGPEKSRRGPKVQRGPNFKFGPGPRSTLDHAQPTHMQCICNSNKIENAQLLILNCKYSFNIKF